MSSMSTPSSTGSTISSGILGIFAKGIHLPILGTVPLGVGLLGLAVVYFGFIRKKGTRVAVLRV